MWLGRDYFAACARAALCLAFAAVLPSLYFEARVLVRHGKRPRTDERYEGLRPSLPADRVLGYVSDSAGAKGLELRLKAQYSLAPHLLEDAGGSARYVVANFADPGRLESAYRTRGLRTLVVLPDGVALLKREGQP